MTIVRVQPGLYLPFQLGYRNNDTVTLGTAIATTIDSASEYCAFIGRVYIDGGPAASSKTLNTTGSSSIGFSVGSATWANAGTTLRVGITGVSTAAGPSIRSDTTYSVYKDCVPGTTTITASAWNTIVPGSGTVTLAHGDLIALVFELRALGGADAVNIQCAPGSNNQTFPSVLNFVSPSTFTSKNALPNAILTFSDGTLGWIDGGVPYLSDGSLAFNSGTAGADEYGNIIQVPFDCKIDALWMRGWSASTTGAVKLRIYSDPLGTPAAMSGGDISLDYHQQMPTSARASWCEVLLASEITLSKNTPYAVMLQPQTTSNFTFYQTTLQDASHLKAWPGGTACYAVKRLDNSGAVATDSTAKRWCCGVRISSIDDGAGAGSSIAFPSVRMAA